VHDGKSASVAADLIEVGFLPGHVPQTASIAGLVLGGWSMGVSGARAQLLAAAPGVMPLVHGLVLIDGLHAPMAKRKADGHIALGPSEIFRPHFDAARAGNGLVVATCTNNIYTETLTKDPFLSVQTCLGELTGWDMSPPTDAPYNERGDGNLLVRSYASMRIDKAAHIRQQREVLPEMLRDCVVPFIASAGCSKP
jgi:hypothetical protein